MKGRILHVDQNRVLICQGRHIFYSNDKGLNWDKYFSIPCGFFLRFLLRSGVLSRLLRLGIHHFVMLSARRAVCIFNNEVLWLDVKTNKVAKRNKVEGRRPLSLIYHNESLYYGEYRSNAERSSVHVWKAKVSEMFWNPVLTLSKVRHIHGVYFDFVEKNFWVTTGDDDCESKVMLFSEGFSLIEVLLQGSQQTRVVQPVFTQKYVYFGSDAPNERNNIYCYCRKKKIVEKVHEVDGPIYFGQFVGGVVFFSTVVEPSEMNNATTVKLWASLNGKDWKCIDKYSWDKLSLRYFQYAQLVFPNQSLESDVLYFSEFATKNHLRLHILDVEKLIKEYFDQD